LIIAVIGNLAGALELVENDIRALKKKRPKAL